MQRPAHQQDEVLVWRGRRHTMSVPDSSWTTMIRSLLSRRLAMLAVCAMLTLMPPARGLAATQTRHHLGTRSVTAQLDGFMSRLVHLQSFRGAVLVARNGMVLLRKGYDLADVQHHVPNTPATEFRIASVTKQF